MTDTTLWLQIIVRWQIRALWKIVCGSFELAQIGWMEQINRLLVKILKGAKLNIAAIDQMIQFSDKIQDAENVKTNSLPSPSVLFTSTLP